MEGSSQPVFRGFAPRVQRYLVHVWSAPTLSLGLLCVILGVVLVGCQPLRQVFSPSASPPSSSQPRPVPASPAPPAPGLTSERPQQAFAAAEMLRIRGKTEEAIQAFADFVRRYPQDALTDDALFTLGDLSALLKRYEQAQAYYRALLRDFPSAEHATAARFGLGVALYETQDYAASLTAFQEALQATPGGKYQVPGHYYLGCHCVCAATLCRRGR